MTHYIHKSLASIGSAPARYTLSLETSSKSKLTVARITIDRKYIRHTCNIKYMTLKGFAQQREKRNWIDKPEGKDEG